MVIVLKVSGAMVSGWTIGTNGRGEAAAANASAPAAAATVNNSQPAAQLAAASAGTGASAPPASDRVRAIVAGTRVPANDVADGPVRDVRVTGLRSVGVSTVDLPNSPATAVDRRVQGIGTRFRPPPTSPNAGRPKP